MIFQRKSPIKPASTQLTPKTHPEYDHIIRCIPLSRCFSIGLLSSNNELLTRDLRGISLMKP
jgi:hypothetical protein